MGKLSENMRWRLIGMLEAGMGVNDVADELHVHRSIVHRWKTRHLAGEDLKDCPRSGRPRVTSANQDASIINRVETTRSSTGTFDSCFISLIYNFVYVFKSAQLFGKPQFDQ